MFIRRKITVVFFILAVTYIIYLVYLIPSLYGKKPSRLKGTKIKAQEEYIDQHGVRVIVGHFKGELGSSINYTKEELNINRYSVVAGAGEEGEPVYMRGNQQILSKRLWGLNQFNLVASDTISINRKLKDVRSEECKILRYPESELTATSIIIVFHNEAWSTLVRTVHSVLNNSPNHLIKEIILVDDASERNYLGEELESHLKTLAAKILILRTKQRIGLIKSRLLGAESAQGEILTFLDAHCECTPGWIEPLLHNVKKSPDKVVCPIIDILDDETFKYTKSFSFHWGAFNAALHFRWYTLSRRVIEQRQMNSTLPYATPVMAGGLFSISRKYFWSIGSYDENMDIWGGENLEMSFRVWQCGGRVEISPCSRVGHVFRKASPYTFPRDGGVNTVLYGNLARVALVWMDQYSRFYFKSDDKAAVASNNQNVTLRLNLRKKLKCQSFDWYLDNVWPESFFPRLGQFYGKIKSKAVGENCLNMPGSRGGTIQPGPAVLFPCQNDRFHLAQMFTSHKNGYIMGDESMCLDSPNWEYDNFPGIRFSSCQEISRQVWDFKKVNSIFNEEEYKIVHRLSGKCLKVSTLGTSDILILDSCDADNEFILWYFSEYKW